MYENRPKSIYLSSVTFDYCHFNLSTLQGIIDNFFMFRFIVMFKVFICFDSYVICSTASFYFTSTNDQPGRVIVSLACLVQW